MLELFGASTAQKLLPQVYTGASKKEQGLFRADRGLRTGEQGIEVVANYVRAKRLHLYGDETLSASGLPDVLDGLERVPVGRKFTMEDGSRFMVRSDGYLVATFQPLASCSELRGIIVIQCEGHELAQFFDRGELGYHVSIKGLGRAIKVAARALDCTEQSESTPETALFRHAREYVMDMYSDSHYRGSGQTHRIFAQIDKGRMRHPQHAALAPDYRSSYEGELPMPFLIGAVRDMQATKERLFAYAKELCWPPPALRAD
jgi:hypothetical protein